MTPDQIKELRRLADRAEGAATMLRETLDEAVHAAVETKTEPGNAWGLRPQGTLYPLANGGFRFVSAQGHGPAVSVEEAPDAAINPKAKWSHEMAQEIARESYWGKQPVDRVTVESIEAKIVREDYLTHAGGSTLTICILTLANGFTVTGESACVDLRNFDPELGKKYAREAAFEKIWPLEGYLLRERMAAAEDGPVAPNECEAEADQAFYAEFGDCDCPEPAFAGSTAAAIAPDASWVRLTAVQEARAMGFGDNGDVGVLLDAAKRIAAFLVDGDEDEGAPKDVRFEPKGKPFIAGAANTTPVEAAVASAQVSL